MNVFVSRYVALLNNKADRNSRIRSPTTTTARPKVILGINIVPDVFHRFDIGNPRPSIWSSLSDIHCFMMTAASVMSMRYRRYRDGQFHFF